MIVAGIGSRKGVSVAEVLAAIDAGLAAHRLARNTLSALATTVFKRDEAGIIAAAEMLGLELVVVNHESDAGSGANLLAATRSPLSLHHAGTPSVSETAALLAVGAGAKLLGPRVVAGRVTCALARPGDAS